MQSDRVAQVRPSSSSSRGPPQGPVQPHGDDSDNDDVAPSAVGPASWSAIMAELEQRYLAESIEREELTDYEDKNFESYSGTVPPRPGEVIAVSVDLSDVLGTPNVSALAADFMRRLLDDDLLMRRDYTEGRPSNPVDPTGNISGGLNPSMIVSGPLTKELKEHELIVIIVDALEAMLELTAVRISVNVHEGDHQNPPTFAQGFHGDYSGDKTRGTLFLTPEGSVRFFQVKESDGTVVFEHEITNDRLTAVVMTGAARQTKHSRRCHSGTDRIFGTHATIVITFAVRCALPSPPFVVLLEYPTASVTRLRAIATAELLPAGRAHR